MATFEIQCTGRDINLVPSAQVLKEPVSVMVQVEKVGNSIYINVDCPHNTGSHGHRCKASHPDRDKVDRDTFCPYAVDLPYAMDDPRS